VKVGGPLRGYNRAVRISALYGINCFVIGAVLSVGVSLFAGRDFVGVVVALVFAHIWITAVMFLTSLPANLLLVRLFRGRTWRNEPWRARTAGALGVVFVPVGLFFGGISGFNPPEIMNPFGEFAGILTALGWFILFSNLALLVAWSLPSRDR
jgi:hypothetical protein